MRAYSQDLRDRVLRALERGDRPAEVAFGVPQAHGDSIQPRVALRCARVEALRWLVLPDRRSALRWVAVRCG
jgi:hypothetical protein